MSELRKFVAPANASNDYADDTVKIGRMVQCQENAHWSYELAANRLWVDGILELVPLHVPAFWDDEKVIDYCRKFIAEK